MNIKTVRGTKELAHGKILAHEHITCYSEYYYMMAKEKYIDKKAVRDKAVTYLSQLKEKFGLCAIVDCTPVNIGRDFELLKEVSCLSGVDIVSSTGFYYTDEIMFARHSDEYIEEMILCDIKNTCPGMIKYAVQAEKMTNFDKTMLNVLCEIQKKTLIPLCVHTNSWAKNGTEVLDFILSSSVKKEAITIGHLSDSEDISYVKDLMSAGIYGGFDRIYTGCDNEYYDKKAKDIIELSKCGYFEKILLSHDGLVFNGFNDKAEICGYNPYSTVFERLVPCLEKAGMSKEETDILLEKNPLNMLGA